MHLGTTSLILSVKSALLPSSFHRCRNWSTGEAVTWTDFKPRPVRSHISTPNQLVTLPPTEHGFLISALLTFGPRQFLTLLWKGEKGTALHIVGYLVSTHTMPVASSQLWSPKKSPDIFTMPPGEQNYSWSRTTAIEPSLTPTYCLLKHTFYFQFKDRSSIFQSIKQTIFIVMLATLHMIKKKIRQNFEREN